MENIITIQEDYKLPSLGKVYRKPIDPEVKLRSMTVAEEMKRLSPTETPYKTMCEIIDDCLITKLPISTYDLCLGDYTYLLHKLRVVTYGQNYKLGFVCPKCKMITEGEINLDEIEINEFDSEKIKELLEVQLPKTGKRLKLRLQTPRDLDKISLKAKDLKKEFPEMSGDPSLLLTLDSLIDSVDGDSINQVTMLDTLTKLPMMDTNVLIQTATKINEMIGVSSTVKVHCDKCNSDVEVPFRFTSEFFGPKVL